MGLSPGVKEVSIHIGGVFASREPAVVRTVLGSCVSACLFDPLTNVGGMNHFMLPTGDQGGDLPTRYGINAMEMLINEIMKLGGEPTGAFVIAADAVGSGVGEVVLVAQGSSARLTEATREKPVDAVIMGIVDTVESSGEVWYSKGRG